jgi:DNA-directed RNA polymerase subunit RPC12/RpoP
MLNKISYETENIMLKLACPSCGANLELPDQLDVAHCMYCGGKIILRSENVLNELVNMKRFSELANVAIQAKNYDDAIKYSNNVLEIDTRNIEAWLIKAEAVFWLSTPLDDKFGTAMQYLDAAARINPEDGRIAEARTDLAKSYSLWLNSRGVAALEHARSIYNIWGNGYATGVMDLVANKLKARTESGPEYLEAMELFLNASKYDAADITTLKNIRICAQEASWISWNPIVLEKIEILHRLETREIAKQYLAGIEYQLTQKKTKLKSLQGKNGFWEKLTRADVQDEVTALEKQLREYQAKASYEVPQVNA